VGAALLMQPAQSNKQDPRTPWRIPERYCMRKIVLSAWITLDGYVAGPGEGKMEWLRGDAQMMEYEQSFVDAADTLLLGRKTFNDFSSYWPPLAQGGEPGAHPLPMPIEQQRQYARTIDPMKKIVVSASGEVAAWRNVSVLSTIDAVHIVGLKHEPGKNIAMYGSLSVVRALSDLGLVGEYELLMHPNFVGRGKSLFDSPIDALEFKSAHPFRSGVVLMKYSVPTSVAGKKKAV
jgi:dihydrofolate reductase